MRNYIDTAIYLRYNKEFVWDYKQIMAKYAAPSASYKMKDDTPLFINVEGSYVKTSDLAKLMNDNNYSKWKRFRKNGKRLISFKWSRV